MTLSAFASCSAVPRITIARDGVQIPSRFTGTAVRILLLANQPIRQRDGVGPTLCNHRVHGPAGEQ